MSNLPFWGLFKNHPQTKQCTGCVIAWTGLLWHLHLSVLSWHPWNFTAPGCVPQLQWSVIIIINFCRRSLLANTWCVLLVPDTEPRFGTGRTCEVGKQMSLIFQKSKLGVKGTLFPIFPANVQFWAEPFVSHHKGFPADSVSASTGPLMTHPRSAIHINPMNAAPISTSPWTYERELIYRQPLALCRVSPMHKQTNGQGLWIHKPLERT